MMIDGDLSPEREEQIMNALLRERGIDQSKVGPVLDLAAIGLVNGAWRNTCVAERARPGTVTGPVPAAVGPGWAL